MVTTGAAQSKIQITIIKTFAKWTEKYKCKQTIKYISLTRN